MDAFQAFEIAMGWDEDPSLSPVVYNNTCYVCGRTFQDTVESEVCSEECLRVEAASDACLNCGKLYILDACEPSNYCSDDCRFEASRKRNQKVAA